jgi:hypothetical protein
MSTKRTVILTIVLIFTIIVGLIIIDTVQNVNTVTATIEGVLTETSLTRAAMP